jgi:hypothetical protein
MRVVSRFRALKSAVLRLRRCWRRLFGARIDHDAIVASTDELTFGKPRRTDTDTPLFP